MLAVVRYDDQREAEYMRDDDSIGGLRLQVFSLRLLMCNPRLSYPFR